MPGFAAVIGGGGILAVTLWGVIRRRPWGFVAAAFFLILAPTSTVVSLAEMIYEHRLYLPLAAVLTLVVLGGAAMGRALVDRHLVPRLLLQVAGGCLVAAAAVLLGWLTHKHNKVYHDDLSFWSDVVEKAPHSPRGYVNLGQAHYTPQRHDCKKAMECSLRAIALKPDYAAPHCNLANVLAELGRLDEAVAEYQQAMKIRPDNAAIPCNLGNVATPPREARQRHRLVPARR